MRHLMFVLLLLVSRGALSASSALCADVFPSAVQSYADNGKLAMEKNVQILGAPSTVLPFVDEDISSNLGTSCETAECSVSGVASEALNISDEAPSFLGEDYDSFGSVFGEGSLNTNVFGNIKAESGITSFSSNFSTYYINDVSIKAGATVNLKPGNYWIKNLKLEDSDTANDIGVNVVGDGIVYIYAQSVEIKKNRIFNGFDGNAAVSITAFKDFKMKENGQGEGVVYALNEAKFENFAVFSGPVAATKVTLKDDAAITYVTDLFDTYDFADTCAANPPPSRRAFYQFNQTGWNGTNTVLDSSGNAFSASPIGGVSPTSYSGGTCVVLDVPANTSSASFDAVDTEIDINDIGNQGSISFWYRSDLAWSDTTPRQLFDASNKVPVKDKHFYLALDSGELQFGVEDDDDIGLFALASGLTFAADQWVHITAIWDLPSNELTLMINTNISSSVVSATKATFDGALGDYDTLYIGDNRTDYLIEKSTGNSAHGQFEDVEIYNYVLTSAEASTNAGSEPICGSLDTELVAHWPMNVCAFDGTAGEVVDVVAGANGVAVDGAAINKDGKLCQSGEFAGDGEHINIQHSNAFEVDDGSLSIWFQVDDLNHSVDSSLDGLALFSKDSSGTDNGGDHLTIYVGSDGGVNVRHQSSSTSYEALSSAGLVTESQWHHLVYSFGADGMQVFLDKQLVASNSYTGGISGNPEPIILGSNAWTTGNNQSLPANLKDHFNGMIDDMRLYSGQLQQNEINALFAETEQDCGACINVETLEANWPLDVCSLTGVSNDIVDVINNYHGTSVDGVAVLDSGKFCKSGDFDGAGSHLNMPSVAAFEAANGAISFWFNAVDLSHSDSPDQGGQGLFSRDSSGYDSGGHLTIWLQPTGSIYVRHQDTSTSNEITSSALISANIWHHLVYSWGDSGMRLYIDGVLVKSNSSFTSGTVGNSEPMIFAANAWATGNSESKPGDLNDFFKGQMDEISFYSSQIDASVVTELYALSDYTCVTCTVDGLIAEYQFEQNSWSGSGAVTDNSLNANHATNLGNAFPIKPSTQIACRSMQVPASSSVSSEFHAIDTQVDVNTIGTKGTISFWYRSNEAWDSGSARQLFDASKDEGDSDDSKYFYLSINNSGQLDFNMEDSKDRNFGATTSASLNIAADVWKHIAVTWDLQGKNSAIDIYIDGVAQLKVTSNFDKLEKKLGDFDTLYIGDNRSDYLVITSTQNSANGEFDDVRIYSFVQSAIEISSDKDTLDTCLFAYKYIIDHDGAGLTCDDESVTITACADASCSSIYDQNITINMSPSTGWPDGSAVTVLANTPTSVDYSQATVGAVTFDVPNEITECTGTVSNTCDMIFSDVGFQFIGATAADEFSDQLGQSAFSNANLRAVRSDVNDGIGVCSALLVGDKTVTFDMSCDDPSTCLTAIQTGSGSLSAGVSTDVTLTFDSQGVASLSGFSYADAGQISLFAQADIIGIDVGVGTTQFVVVPDQLSILSTAATEFTRAGVDFALQLSALGSSGGVLPNYQPGNLQFGLSRLSPLDTDSVNGVLTYALSATMSVPATASFQDSAISYSNVNVTNSSGVYSFDAQYNEYGQILLDVRDSNYFTNVITSAPASATSPLTLGSFIPAYFDVTKNTPLLASICDITSGFTYLGQDTDFSTDPEIVVTAKNANGQTTQNYQAASLWSWLSSADASDITLADSGLTGTVTFNTAPTITVSENGQLGSRTASIDDGRVLYSKSTTPYAPFTSNLDMSFLPSFITDSSFTGAPICHHQSYNKVTPDDCDTDASLGALDDTNNVVEITAIAGTEYRWGRLLIGNAIGPENEDLLMPVTTQYHDGNYFVKNVDDSCTTQTFTNSDFTLLDMDYNLTTSISVLNSNFGITSGKTLGFEGINVHNVDQTLMGEYRIELEPVADATITWDDYLQFDWNGADAGVGNPSATLVFGQFRGNDKIIHWREVGN